MPYEGRSTLHTVKEEHQVAIFGQQGAIRNRWARWRPHRLCGVEAESEGRFTIPTVFRLEKELRLNYRCAPGGWISVELLPRVPTMLCPDANPLKGVLLRGVRPSHRGRGGPGRHLEGKRRYLSGRRDGGHPRQDVSGEAVRLPAVGL